MLSRLQKHRWSTTLRSANLQVVAQLMLMTERVTLHLAHRVIVRHIYRTHLIYSLVSDGHIAAAALSGCEAVMEDVSGMCTNKLLLL